MKNTERKVPRFKKKSKLMLIKTKEFRLIIIRNNESVSVCQKVFKYGQGDCTHKSPKGFEVSSNDTLFPSI